MSNVLTGPAMAVEATVCVPSDGMMHGEAKRLAAIYVGLGWSVLPIKNGSKEPAGKWKQYQSTRAESAEVLSWLSQGHGLAVTLGGISESWICRDFDEADSFHRWQAAYPELGQRLPISQTGRGYHVFFPSSGAVATKKFGDGELRAEGAYVVLPPSRHPDGGQYRWLREPQPCSPLLLRETGLGQDWTVTPATETTETTETTERPEATENTERPENTEPTELMASVNYVSSGSSANCVSSVDSVTPEQHREILRAIEMTVPKGVGRRNDGIFQFARKLIAILRGELDDDVIDRCALAWYEAAKPTIKTIDAAVTIADLHHAVANVRVADDGRDVLSTAIEMAKLMPPPWFVSRLPGDSAGVLLAKLLVELDRLADGNVFFLSCRDAGRLTGLPHTHANRLLNRWKVAGVLDIVERGKPGPPGSKASRYRLLPRST